MGRSQSSACPGAASDCAHDTLEKGGWFRVTKVRVRPDEPFEKALRRFKKKCNKEGLMQRLKEVKHYEKPSERRRRKLAKAIARQAASTE